MDQSVFFAPADRRALVIPGLPADKNYTFQVRAYRKVDKDVALGGVVLSDAIATAPYQPSATVDFTGDILGTIQGRSSLQVVVNLEAIASDSVLSTVEKSALVIEHARAMDEATRLDARAAALGATYDTRRATLTNARTALNSYLNSLSPAWNDTTQHTMISPSVFRSNWDGFYQALNDLSTSIADPSITLRPSAQAFIFTDGEPFPVSQTITLTALLNNMSGTVTWSTTPAVTLGGSGNTRTLPVANFGPNRQVVVEATLNGVTDRITIVRTDRSTGVLAGLDAVDAGGPLLIGQLPVDKAVSGLRNSAITIDGSGVLQGAGTAGVHVANSTVVPSGALAERPNNGLFAGQQYFATDVGRMFRWNGSFWVQSSDITSQHTAAAISGQGSLATRNNVGWVSDVMGRPTELIDGRIVAGIRPDGSLQSGIWGGAATVDAASLLEAGLTGKRIARDPDFAQGNPLGIYNNSGGTSLVMSRLADSTAPNGSGHIIRVSYDGIGPVSPEFGGVSLFLGRATVSRPGFYASGTKVVYVLRARIPAGRNLLWTTNAIGEQPSIRFLTSNVGTGDWATYLVEVVHGKVGSFSFTGYWYITGGPTTPLSWDIALADCREIGSTEVASLDRLIDSTGNFRGDAQLITNQGTAAAISGQGALATANAANFNTQITDVPTRLGPSPWGPQWLDSQRVIYVNGIGLDGLRPAEFGSNVTETRVAAAITGQGTLATRSNVVWASDVFGRPEFLTNTMFADGLERINTWYIRNPNDGSYLTERWAAEGGANVTENRVAAAISGQGSLATRSNVGWVADVMGKPFALQDGAFNASGRIIGERLAYNDGLTIQALRPEEGGSNRTESRVAAAISGQAPWATSAIPTSKLNFLNSDGTMYLGAGRGIVSEGGAFWLTNANTVTSFGTAAAISGQGALATQNNVSWNGGQITNKPIVAVQSVTADEFTTDASVWSGTWQALFVTEGDHTYVRAPAGEAVSPIGSFATATPIDHSATYEAYWELMEEGTGTPDGRQYTVVIAYDAQGNAITGDGTFWAYPQAFFILPSRGVYHQYAARFGKGTARPFPANAVKFHVGVLMNLGTYSWQATRARRFWARKIESELLETTGTSWTLADSRAIRLGGPEGWGHGIARSKSAIVGPQSVYAEPTANGAMMGLASGTPTWWGNLAAAMFYTGSGVEIYADGALVAQLQGYSNADNVRLRIDYDGVNFLFNINGAHVWTLFAGSSRSFRAAFETFNPNQGFRAISHEGARSASIIGSNTFNISGALLTSGALVTSEGVAAAIAGQGSLATRSNVGWASDVIGRPAFLTDTLLVDSTERVNPWYVRGPSDNSLLGGRWPAEANANVTENRVAAAIAGQGSLATRNNVGWVSDVMGRPAELTDGRITTALRSDGSLQSGLWGGSGSVPNVQVLEAGLTGKRIARDPDFVLGNPLIGYNNSGGTALLLSRVADPSAPNGSGFIIRLSYSGAGETSPGFGGFTLALQHGSISRPGFYAQGTKVVYVLRARIPVGRNIEFATNNIGTGSAGRWLTSRMGTGGWATYLFEVTHGVGGDLSVTGYFWIEGGANTAFSWDVALADCREVGSTDVPTLDRIVGSDGIYRGDADLITNQGTAAAISGQGSLATRSNVGWVADVMGKPFALQDGAFNASGRIIGERLAYNDGLTIQALRPEEGGSNRTESRVAAAISGQAPWATTAVPISKVLTVRPNMFPYPYPPMDGRTPAQVGWQNGAGGVFGGFTTPYLDGDFYGIYRPSGGGVSQVNPFFDMDFPGELQCSVGLNGYGGGASFTPYIEFLSVGKSSTLAVHFLAYNPINDRWELNGVVAPSGTVWLRLVVRGTFVVGSGYQDIVWWGIKVERGPNATPISENSLVKLPAQSVEYNNGLQLNSLRPAEFGSNVTETRVASAISGQGRFATQNAIQLGVNNGLVDENGNFWLTNGNTVTALGTAAAIANQGDLATRNSATLPFGTNSVVNSDFTLGMFGWTSSASLGINLDGYFGRRNVVYMTTGALAAGSVHDLTPSTLWNGLGTSAASRFALPVAAGDRVYARALLAPHRCIGQVFVLVFNQQGDLIQAASTSGGAPGGALQGDNFGSPVEQIITVTSGAAWAIPMFRMLGTGEGSPYLFVAEPAIGKLASNQTVVPPYTSGRADPSADVTATISGPAEQVMQYRADLSLTSPLPATSDYQLGVAGASAMTSGVSWSVSVVSGTFAGAAPSIVGSGTGQLRINSSLTSPEATLRITASVAGRMSPPFIVVVRRQVAPPTSTPFISLNSTNFTIAHEQPIQVQLPSTSTSVTLSAVSDLLLSASGPGGVTAVEGKWQRESSPGTWVDVGSVASALPSPEVIETEPFPGELFYTAFPGSITCNRTATGLPAGSIQRFRFVARISGGIQRFITMVGNGSAVA